MVVPPAAVVTAQEAIVQTKNEPKLEVLVPILKMDHPKVENLSIKYEFPLLTNKAGYVAEESHQNFDNPVLLFSEPDLKIMHTTKVSDLIKLDKPKLTPYYNTLMLWQDKKKPNKRSLPKEIDRFGYRKNIRIC